MLSDTVFWLVVICILLGVIAGELGSIASRLEKKLPTDEELQDWWRSELRKGGCKVVD